VKDDKDYEYEILHLSPSSLKAIQDSELFTFCITDIIYEFPFNDFLHAQQQLIMKLGILKIC
jgi:hypothetical protein